MAFDIGSLIGQTLGSTFKEIAGVFKVDPTTALETSAKLEEIRLNLEAQLGQQITAQIDVNKVEAASPSVFVAGWRPFCGWVAGMGLVIQFIVNPIATWGAALAHHPIVFPTLDLGSLMTLLLGMLGLGTLRTYEKVAGVPGSDKLK